MSNYNCRKDGCDKQYSWRCGGCDKQFCQNHAKIECHDCIKCYYCNSKSKLCCNYCNKYICSFDCDNHIIYCNKASELFKRMSYCDKCNGGKMSINVWNDKIICPYCLGIYLNLH